MCRRQACRCHVLLQVKGRHPLKAMVQVELRAAIGTFPSNMYLLEL